MRRICQVVVVAVALLAVSSPASAQEAVDLDISIGLQGYVLPSETATLTVRVTSDVLFVGDLEASSGGTSIFTEIEVPAGSTKEYVFEVPAVRTSNRVVVRLYPEGSDDHLVRESIAVRYPGDQVLVGIVGAPQIEPTLMATTTTPFGRPLETLDLSPEDLAFDLGPLSYLVIGDGALATAGPEVLGSIGRWVAEGGRVVGAADDVRRVDAASGDATVLTNGAVVATVGDGELVVVDSVTDVGDWSAIIRDVPALVLGSEQPFREFGIEMIQVASSTGASVAPRISWLLIALAVYVLMVGPVNLFVLRRLHRRELAWITIPVLSLLMLGVLWVAGRSQLDDRIVTHASIVVQDDEGSRATSSMIVVAGGEGEHVVDVPNGWGIAPLDVSMFFGTGGGLEARVGSGPDGGTRMGFELPNLGAATVTAKWRPEPIPLRSEVKADGAKLTATVSNDSEMEFWAWGIGSGFSAAAAAGPLAPGQSASVTLQTLGLNEGGMTIADAVSSQRNWNWEGSDNRMESLWPLSSAMSQQEARTLQAGPFFFGFTGDLVAEINVDGGSEVARGLALVVVPLDVSGGGGGFAQPGEIVQISGADFVDSYAGWVYASGADSIDVQFTVAPDAAGDVTIKSEVGGLPPVDGVEVYNWATASFDGYAWPGDFPLDDHLSPTNELMARIVFTDLAPADLNLPTGAFRLAAASP